MSWQAVSRPTLGSDRQVAPGCCISFSIPSKRNGWQQTEARWLQMVGNLHAPPPPRWRCCTFLTISYNVMVPFSTKRHHPPCHDHHPTGMPATVGGSPATVASIAFASRQFLSDLLGSSGVVQSGAVAGPGAELMAAQAEEQRCVSKGKGRREDAATGGRRC